MENINSHKYEYYLKQEIYSNWRYRDITGTEKAIKRMKKNLELLKRHNPKSKYIEKLEKFISDKESLILIDNDIEFIKQFIAELRTLNSSPNTLYPLNVKLEKSLSNILEQTKELKEITNRYDAICKNDVDYILIANKSYFDNGIFKNNLIHISKIIDLKRYYEEQAEETKRAYGKLGIYPTYIGFIDRLNKILEEK